MHKAEYSQSGVFLFAARLYQQNTFFRFPMRNEKRRCSPLYNEHCTFKGDLLMFLKEMSLLIRK